MPGLEVDGVGLIRLPLGNTQARKLIGECTQDPYGRAHDALCEFGVGERGFDGSSGFARIEDEEWQNDLTAE